jgi:hypothetical protein
MATVMVVRAGGPSSKNFPLGKRLPENARVVLLASDRLTLLDSRGTRELRGPGAFLVASASLPTQFDPSRLFSAYSGGRARIGAIRHKEEPPRPPTLWQIDVSKSTNACVPASDKIALWRADAAADATLTVTGAGGTRRIDWPAGNASLAWPDDFPVTDGAQYRLSWPGAAASTEIRFKPLPQRPVGLEETASMLIANQCNAQLDLLIDTARIAG